MPHFWKLEHLVKKLLVLSLVSTTMLAGVAVSAYHLFGTNGFKVERVVASTKQFVLDATVGANQFKDHYTGGQPAEISVVTGISSNLETSVTLPKSTEEDYSVRYGDNERFVRNGETISPCDFEVEVGVNNLQNVAVVYGCEKTSSTNVTELHCRIDVKDEDGDWHTNVSGSSGTSFNLDRSLTWSKSTETYTVKGVRVRVGVSGGSSVFWGEPLYIKNIELTWAC